MSGTRQRLTHLVTCGGCTSKIGPSRLTEVLKALPRSGDPNLLVGLQTGDDAGVYRLSEHLALVQTVDFFTPIVDDPYLYGQIAATNALSDVYAMGGRPLTALNILCCPVDTISIEDIGAILRGGVDKVVEAGATLMGGHSVEDAEPKYGLAVTGLIDPAHITSNAGAQPGDVIVLTKALGTGVIATAAKLDSCDATTLKAATDSMTTLNAGAAEAMRSIGIGPELPIHAATDVTGFSLLGHLFHMARASEVAIEIDAERVPILPDAERLAADGFVTNGGRRNLDYVTPYLTGYADLAPERLAMLADPQTSGGLAICVASDALDRLLEALTSNGVTVRAVIGRVRADAPGIILH